MRSVVVFTSLAWLKAVLFFVFSISVAYLKEVLHLSSSQVQPTSLTWIQHALQKKFDQLPPISCLEKSAETLPGRGLSSFLYKVMIKYKYSSQREEDCTITPSPYPQSVVIKQDPKGFRGRLYSIYLQNAREAIFYKELVPRHSILSTCVPEVYYSRGSMLTGEFVIVMQDLTGKSVPSSLPLGDQYWGETGALPRELEQISARDVIRTIFVRMADVHAHFWRDETLMNYEWLRGVCWRKGGERWRWEASFDNMRYRWRTLMRKKPHHAFTTLQCAIVEGLFQQTTWKTWQRRNKPDTALFTLVHGDFHAGNVLWMIDQKVEAAIFVDWSEVGVGCPFTELAQFMVSNATIEFRRQNERELFEEYYSRLVERGVDSHKFPREKCWIRYKEGGIERWLQLLILLANFGLPEPALKWFIDQVEGFIQDHSSFIPECFNTVYAIPVS